MIKTSRTRALFDAPQVMGIINVSPDSFYRPATSMEQVLRDADQMVSDGVDIIDIGGEATNPAVDLGEALSVDEELDRVIPAIEMIRQRFDVKLSVDTSQAEVMKAAIASGVFMINDQRALTQPEARQVVSDSGVKVCLMHALGQSRHLASKTSAECLQITIHDLSHSAQCAMDAGIDSDNIVIDPGFGQGHYGKSCQANYHLLANLDQFVALGYPVLIGWSRKSMIRDVVTESGDLLAGSIAAAVLGVANGARIVRVHDVKPTVDAIRVWSEMVASA